MVRYNPDSTVAQSRKQNPAAETQNQSQPQGEPAEPEGAERRPEGDQPESQEPTESQLDLLQWRKLKLHKEPDTWGQPIPGAGAEGFPTHLRPFSSAAQYQLVERTYQQLQHSGYYWGAMAMGAAHGLLARAPPGAFLIRDSGQPDVFFTLSYRSADGPTSVRVQLSDLLFGLSGSHRTFASLFGLLTYYTGAACKLTAPYRRQRPERLKQMCRRALAGAHGAQNIATFPGLSAQVKDYVQAYPCCI